MKTYLKKLAHTLAIGLTSLMVLLPINADAKPNNETPSAGAMALDMVVARPLLLATTVVGAGAYVVTLPFSWASGSAKQAGKVLVAKPAINTFVRCLGCVHTGYQKD